MELPATVRQRLQAAMPMLPPSPPFLISCQLPTVTPSALGSLQVSVPTPGLQQGNSSLPPQSPVLSARNISSISGKGKSLTMQDPEMEIDPWTLLEDSAGSRPATCNGNVGVGGDHANLKACSWLKGALRVRRTDLAYIGAVDDDS